MSKKINMPMEFGFDGLGLTLVVLQSDGMKSELVHQAGQ